MREQGREIVKAEEGRESYGIFGSDLSKIILFGLALTVIGGIIYKYKFKKWDLIIYSLMIIKNKQN